MRKLAMSFLIAFVVAVPLTAFATSWVYIFVVWDGHIYEVTDEKVLAVGKQIGKVTSYSDMQTRSGNFSNHYPKGTKYFKIDGIEPSDAIAVEVGDGQYKKAEKRGPYEESSLFAQNMFYYFAIILLVFLALILGRRKVLLKK